MKIKHCQPFHDGHPIESDIDHLVRCNFDNMNTDIYDFASKLLVLLYSKNIINDGELLSLIGEHDGEIVK
jgi:hypothetical protein